MWDLMLYFKEKIMVENFSALLITFFLHPPSSGDDDGAERGLVHTWKGYSCSVTPERLLLPRPVLQVALGSRHGVLLVEGNAGYSLFLFFGDGGRLQFLPPQVLRKCYQ